MLEEMEKVVRKFQQNLEATQDRKKSYADWKRIYGEFKVGDYVFVWIKPNKTTLRWASSMKLASCFCEYFKILKKIRPVAYKLALASYVKVHNVFNVSFLKQYVYDPNHVIH